MPQTLSQSGPDLRIDLERAKDTGFCEFTGGDTIYGHVVRESPLVDTDASIHVRLHGRSECRFVASSGMTSVRLSSHFTFFDGSREGLQIYRGPLHIPLDRSKPGRWPFAIPLPKHPDLAALERNHPSEKSFSPLGAIASQGIPLTFRAKKEGLGPVLEGFVEYYLEVMMRCSSTRSTLTGIKKNKEFKAVKMVYVRSDVSPTPITDFDIKRHSELKQKVASQRLVAGDSKLSVSQHIKKMIGSSQIPIYAFSLQLHVASVLQVGNPNYIPLRFRAETSWTDTSEVLKSTPPMILVKSFVLNLQTMSFCWCKNFRSKKLRAEGMPVESSLTLVKFSWKPDLKTASDADATPEKAGLNAPPSADRLIVPQDITAYLDLGVALKIRTPNKPGKEKIYPTFTTCNIKHIHYLEWWMTLVVGGETVRYHRRQPVIVIGPASVSAITSLAP